MITLETTITGFQIGEALAGDLEELAFCMAELASDLSTDDFEDVAEHVHEPEIVGPFLRALAEAIHPTTELDND
tara:strand:- start:547 stop:768 length:222 start_codon:yes stop_codon:yes gene_type:complete